MINWLKEGRACKEGIDWCKENCGTMEDVWDKLKRVDWLVWVATRKGVLTDKELRLFACFCARQNWNLLTCKSRNAIEVAEWFANGNATKEELKLAYDAYARAYASAADRAAANAAYADAAYAYDAARAADAAYAARVASAAAAYPAHAAAADAARAARAADAAYAADAAAAAAYPAHAAAADAARAAAYAGKEQMEWLRANTMPNFGETK